MNCFEYLKVTDWHSEYDSVNKPLRYLETCRINSTMTKEDTLETIYLFSQFAAKNPDEIIAMDVKALESKINEFIARYRTNSTRNTYSSLLKTFLRENNRNDIKFIRYHESSRHGLRILPFNLSQAWDMVDASPPKLGSFLSIEIVTGLRPSTAVAIPYGKMKTDNRILCHHTIKNELDSGIKNPIIVVYEEMEDIKKGACKGDVCYYTFLHEKAKEYLIKYIKNRIALGGPIKDDEVLFPTAFHSVPADLRRYTPMSLEGLNWHIKRLGRIVGIANANELSCYSFRYLFENILFREPNVSNVNDLYLRFFMGWMNNKTQEAYHIWADIDYTRLQYQRLAFLPDELGADRYWDPVAEFHGIPKGFFSYLTQHQYGENPSREQYKNVLAEIIRKKRIFAYVDENQVIDHANKGWVFINWTPSGKALMYRDTFSFDTEASDKCKEIGKSDATTFDIAALEKHYAEWMKKINEKKRSTQLSLCEPQEEAINNSTN